MIPFHLTFLRRMLCRA